MIDVIVVADQELDNILSYIKKNKRKVNTLSVLAESTESEITTYISKVSNVGLNPGKWSFFRVVGEMGNAIDIHISKTKLDVVVMDGENYKGFFEGYKRAI